MQSWQEYIFDYSDDAAARVMKGANLSGRAINLSQTTAVHAMSYKVTSLYYLPHGHAVAVCLPEIWRLRGWPALLVWLSWKSPILAFSAPAPLWEKL